MDRLLRRLSIEQFHPEEQFTYDAWCLLYVSSPVPFYSKMVPCSQKTETKEERESTSRMCRRIVPFRTLTNSTFSFFLILSPYFRLRTFLSHVTPIRNELIVRYRNHPPENVGLFYLKKFRRAISKRTMDSERKGKSTVLLLRGYGNTVVQNNWEQVEE